MVERPIFHILVEVSSGDEWAEVPSVALFAFTRDDLDHHEKRIHLAKGIACSSINDWDCPEEFYDGGDGDPYRVAEFRYECAESVTSSADVRWHGYIKHTDARWSTDLYLSLDTIKRARDIMDFDTPYDSDTPFHVEMNLFMQKQKIIPKGAGIWDENLKFDSRTDLIQYREALVNLAQSKVIMDGERDQLPVYLPYVQELLEENEGHPVYTYLKELIEQKLKED